MRDDEPGLPSLDGYQVTELDADDPQWMMELLANPAFSRVPASHYPGLLASFRPLQADAGARVIRQGEAGDAFYLIRSGRARVTRTAPSGQDIVLAELGPGQTFGEEALLSGAPRNASVTLLTPGQLMYLEAKAFHTLLASALVKGLPAPVALDWLRRGAQLVDVREPEACAADALPGALHLPLFLLRMRLGELDRTRPCIVYCDDGRRSATATFLLVQRGFDAHLLLGGRASLAAVSERGGSQREDT